MPKGESRVSVVFDFMNMFSTRSARDVTDARCPQVKWQTFSEFVMCQVSPLMAMPHRNVSAPKKQIDRVNSKHVRREGPHQGEKQY